MKKDGNLKTRSAKKGEIIQQKGAVNSKVYFVKTGLLRSYSIDNKGKEHIFMFGPEGWTVADACAPDVPCQLFIDALEDTEYLIREKNIHLDGNPQGFQALTRRLFVLQERILMNMSSSAIDRYEHFEKTYPELVQRVPQKMIASYLGITPEGLSKVKSQRVKY